jgi:hypothetical protein
MCHHGPVTHDELRSDRLRHAPATAHPSLSIRIGRELATVIVTLEGLLDEDSSPALVALLWDLVVGQGNLSVTVDARRLSVSEPALVWVFQALEREASLRGGTLDLVEPSPPCPSTEPDLTAADLDDDRVRRVIALGRAAHPSSGRSDDTYRRGEDRT